MTDHYLKRLALLEQADRILDEVRVCHHDRPIRQSIAHRRALLAKARRHIADAQALAASRPVAR